MSCVCVCIELVLVSIVMEVYISDIKSTTYAYVFSSHKKERKRRGIISSTLFAAKVLLFREMKLRKKANGEKKVLSEAFYPLNWISS